MRDQGEPEVKLSLKCSKVALYLQLADLFRNRIASGYWPVGSRLIYASEGLYRGDAVRLEMSIR